MLPGISELFYRKFPDFWTPALAIYLLPALIIYVLGRKELPIRRRHRWIFFSLSAALSLIVSLQASFLAFLLQICVLLTLARFWRYERSVLFSALIGSLASFALLCREGIPLTDPLLRASISSSPVRACFQVSSIFVAAYSQAKYGRRGLIFLLPLATMAVLLGYKGCLASVVASALISGMITAEIKFREAFLIALPSAIALFLLGTLVARASYGSWDIPWFLYLLYRMGFTVHVYQEVARISVPFGLTHGLAMLDPTKRVIADVLGVERGVGITATLTGPATLDFGVLGVLGLSAVLGACLRAMHPSSRSKMQIALYSSSLARILTLIDVGVGFIDLSYILGLLYLSLETR